MDHRPDTLFSHSDNFYLDNVEFGVCIELASEKKVVHVLYDYMYGVCSCEKILHVLCVLSLLT